MKANQKIKSLREDKQGLIFEMLIGAVFALIIGYAAMNIGVYINGTVGNSLVGTFPTTLTSRTHLQNNTVLQLTNLSADLASNTALVSVAYLITIITLPLLAVVMVKKFI